MRDVLMDVYNALIKNEVISSKCSGRIKFYNYPESGDTKKDFMIITPMDPPEDAIHGSNDNLGEIYFYQIDVQSNDRTTPKLIQNEVKKELRKLGFVKTSGGLDEYFEKTKKYVDARRYIACIFKEGKEK